MDVSLNALHTIKHTIRFLQIGKNEDVFLVYEVGIMTSSEE